MENYEVKIYEAGIPELWYVYIYDPSIRKIIKKFYKGINKTDDPNERLKRAQYLQKEVELQLKAGVKFNSNKNALPTPYQVHLNIVEAYENAGQLFNESDKSDDTKKEYKSHRKYFIKSVKNLNWQNNRFVDLEAFHITMLLEEMIKIRQREKADLKINAYFNKHLSAIKSHFTMLKNNFIIKDNKAHGIPERKHKTKEKNLLNDQEQTEVINHFKDICPQFITYLKVLYHLGIRPKEMRLIKCSMIDTKNWFFILPEEITKNDKEGLVIIPDDIKKDLIKYNLSNPDYYLFGNLVNRSWSLSNQYLPSPYIMATSCATRLWKKEVKDKLKIDSDLYYLKSKGANDKLRNKMNIEDVKDIMRHSSKEITKIYATEELRIRMEQNKDKFGTFE
ncbi:tyrosine-type recombinase/integrase [Elizabethkingia anophelis]|uniref:tyrosine-type recombinase/integrase n=1 Tax=Elizabethkingia anophelis TaxID=1117645 RepID=UPI0038911D0E